MNIINRQYKKKLLIVCVIFCAISVGVAEAANNQEDLTYDQLDEGEIHGNPTIVDGINGPGFQFEGEGYATTSNAFEKKGFTTDGDYSIGIWFKLPDMSERQFLIGDQEHKYSNPAVYITDDGKPVYRVFSSRDSFDFSVGVSGEENTIEPGEWYHLSIASSVDDGKTEIALYIDGELQESKVTNEDIEFSGVIDIARGEWNHQNKYGDVTVSDVQITENSLSGTEIRALYTSGEIQTFWGILYYNRFVLPILLLVLSIIVSYTEFNIKQEKI